MNSDAPSQHPTAESLREMRAATERLLSTVRVLDDAGAGAPSRLPGWSRGHVLTHLARNADGLVNLLNWARTGVETAMYASQEARDAAIEAGAGRPADVLLDDLSEASRRLDEQLDAMPAEALDRVVRIRDLELPARDLPSTRVQEIEIHLVDLDLGYTPACWPNAFTLRMLDSLAPLFRDQRDSPVRVLEGARTGCTWQVGRRGPVLRGPEPALLAWLTGRSDGEELEADPPGPTGALPRAPRWR